MKLLLILFVLTIIGVSFASSSNAYAKNGQTRAEINIVVPLGFPDPTTSGGVGNVRAAFNRSHRQQANEFERRRGMFGITLDAVSDVRLGTVTAHLTNTLWQINAEEDRSLRSSTPQATTDIYLEDELLIIPWAW